ncbi:MAG: L,D-transpeptidase family protein [Ferruginibacter sp.]|nr:L,D-transpeptidase family protein [Ferruginibacter sp.]
MGFCKIYYTVKKAILKISLLLLTLNHCCSKIFSQITPEKLQQHIAAGKDINKAELNAFYAGVNYQPVWFKPGGPVNRNILLNTIRQSYGLGFNEKDYQFVHFEKLRIKNFILESNEDSVLAEIYFTDAALHLYHDIAYGNKAPALGYNGLNYKPGCTNIAELLAANISRNTLEAFAFSLAPLLPEVKAMEAKIKWYNRVISDTGYRETKITSAKVSVANIPLLTKLYQLGIIKSTTDIIADSTLKNNIKEAQHQFCLLADGVLRSTTLLQLNTPIKTRLEQLKISINYYRWLNCLTQTQSVIVVNIPAAYLKVYHNNNVLLEMRMVVGKPSTPTPTLASKIDEVVLYPYWHVPYSIATKELLPAIKRNPGYIDAGNYQVLNSAGKIVDPYTVNWRALSAGNFPYLIRQSTGCDNALGLLKLNFVSPFGVYLHDTNNKNAFMLSRRYLSHGCMRMQKPMDLGHLVLQHNKIAIDTLEQKGCLRNQSPVKVKANGQMPVIVWYNPAGIDSTGRILFYEDVYKKF